MLGKSLVSLLIVSLLVLVAGQYCTFEKERREFRQKLFVMRDIAHMEGRSAIVAIYTARIGGLCRQGRVIHIDSNKRQYICTLKRGR